MTLFPAGSYEEVMRSPFWPGRNEVTGPFGAWRCPRRRRFSRPDQAGIYGMVELFSEGAKPLAEREIPSSTGSTGRGA